MSNVDPAVVDSFGREWSKFDHRDAASDEVRLMFESYFALFPWAELPPSATGFDRGCGTGRWARFVAPRVGRLHCVDASAAAIEVARRNLAGCNNCEFHCASVDAIPLPPDSADFGYSLGVLHHVPDTPGGLAACVRKLKPGAPFLLYLYYAFDNRPWWFRTIWKSSDVFRRLICNLPFGLKSPVCDALAGLIYWPLARTAKVLEKLGGNVDAFPLSAYRHRSFYQMRTDALDRFGTRLEQRFTRREMRAMMEAAGLERIAFSDSVFWCALGYRGSGF
jgi:SAM-dependent methyltransferase